MTVTLLDTVPERITASDAVPATSVVDAKDCIVSEAVLGTESASIVTVAVALLIVAPDDGLESTTVNVSAPSCVASLRIGTVIVLAVSFAANVRVPDVEVKSVPAIAVPFEVA